MTVYMETTSKKISVSQLRPGMYIEDVFNENELLLFSAETLINGYHEIESLKKQGVSYLFVNIKKSKGQSVEVLTPPKDTAFPELPRKNVDANGFPELSKVVVEDASKGTDVLQDYEKMIQQTINVTLKPVNTLRQMLVDIRDGRAIYMQTIRHTVEEIVEN